MGCLPWRRCVPAHHELGVPYPVYTPSPSWEQLQTFDLQVRFPFFVKSSLKGEASWGWRVVESDTVAKTLRAFSPLDFKLATSLKGRVHPSQGS